AADPAAHEAREHLRAAVGLRPGPGVADHERGEAVGVPGGDAEPDRPAPVLDHHRDAGQVELLDQLLHDPRVLDRREAVAGGRRREPEAGVVGRDAAVAVAQRLDDVAVEERPGWIAVQEQERRPAPLVHVMDAGSAYLGEMALEWIELVRYPARPGHSLTRSARSSALRGSHRHRRPPAPPTASCGGSRGAWGRAGRPPSATGPSRDGPSHSPARPRASAP